MEFQNYYQVLGVSRNIDSSELKTIYHKLCKEYHPDSNLNLSLEAQKERQEQFKTIANAYAVLSDSSKRIRYDREYDAYLEKKQHRADAFSRDKEPDVSKRSFTDRMASFYQECKKSYREIRREERRHPFEKRHEKFDRNIYREFYHDDYNSFQEFVFIVGKGTAHVFYETLYQLYKLNYVRKDSMPKFVIRNRVGIATVAFALGFGSAILPPSSEEIQASIQEAIEEFSVHRIYEVKEGDSLESISANTHVSEELLLQENSSSSFTSSGESIIIPYKISEEQLDSYTKTQDFSQDLSLEEYAKSYQTDIATLVSLNRDAVLNVKDQYVVLSDTLTVPDFTAINHGMAKSYTKTANRL